VCGIAGLIDVSATLTQDGLSAAVDAMTQAVAHRGPDDSGAFLDAPAGLALGHRRLAVLDLSPSGHQPMISQSGRYALVFNGEIYNFRALRRALERDGVRFRGTGDTEVLLEGWERWGQERLLREINGMFALAIWDANQRTLTLVRDRLGEKPLYWVRAGSVVAFASELRSLRHAPGFSPTVDRAVVAEMLRWGFVAGDESVLSGVHRVPPGSRIVFDGRAERSDRYWDVAAVASRESGDPADLSDEDIVERTGHLLADAVAQRMESDVPLGVFLSGGVDSSLVTALAVEAAGDVRTFTVGMAGRTDLDESAHAEAVARHLGTTHTSITLRPDDVVAAVPDLADTYDEPFGDPSGLAVLLLARLTREHVTVALTGDGGDEVFAGYNRYAAAQNVLGAARHLPPALSRLAGRAVSGVPLSAWQRLAGGLGRVRPLHGVPEIAGKLHRAGAVLTAGDLGRAWLALATVWTTPPVLDVSISPPTPPGDRLRDLVLRDQQVTLPDDMLVKVDRATMSVALESRVPLLDHRLVEWSWALPDRALVRDGRGKWVLRELLRRHVPDALVDRPKLGFDPPVGAWLRGPLRDWAGDMLNPDALARHGVVDPTPVRHAWRQHLAGRADHTYRLWAVLMLEAWLGRWSGASSEHPPCAGGVRSAKASVADS
jgi:asparagine synthase (glutamine-hydrolysing)